MRTDDNQPKDTDFDASMTDPFASVENGSSLSGNERNVLFLGREGRSFEDVSGVSGADDPADGRGVALLDYDRDGWQDLAVVNANSPLLQLFRNEIGDGIGSAGVLALRFVGSNQAAQPAPGRTARDGFGARVEVELSDTVLVREHRAGEGFATQNSATLLVGIGSAEGARSLRVHWPSGRVQEMGPVPEGSLVTVYEEPSLAPDGRAFALEPYRLAGIAAGAAARFAKRRVGGNHLDVARANGGGAALKLITTMATWCDTCKGELPQIARLRQAFGPDEVALLAVPVDEDDDAEKLETYERDQHPAYQLLKTLREEQIEAVRQRVLEDLRLDVLPATIATDGNGRVIRTMWDVPSISEVRELLSDSWPHQSTPDPESP